MQFLIMPFLGFSAVVMLKNSGFTEAMGLSLLVVTSSPGGSYSNWWCSVFNAELALSVAMTSVSSILSLGLLPANLFFYSWLAYSVVLKPDEGDEEADVIGALDFNAIFISLVVVLSAIVLGLSVGYRWDNATFRKRANSFGSFCGLSLILFSAFLGGGGGDADTDVFSLPWSFYFGTAFPCILGMSLANVISRSCRLSPPETVAISIECCYQNTAIATSVAITMFSDPDERAEAISVPLFYGLVEALIIGVYCVWAWKMGWTKAPADEKFCVVTTRTYEVGEDQEEEEVLGELPDGWFARLFVPREVERQHFAVPQDSPSKGTGKHIGKPDARQRDRFESADATIATSIASPPGTPETSLETVIQEEDPEIGTPQREAADIDLYPKEEIDDEPIVQETKPSDTQETKPSQSLEQAPEVQPKDPTCFDILASSVDMTGWRGSTLDEDNPDSSSSS